MAVTRIDQDMAASAAAMLPDSVDKELRTRYRQVRAMLHGAGLAATYAFVAAKSNGRGDLPDAYRKVASGIRTRLAVCGIITTDPDQTTHREVLNLLGGAGGAAYARASAEVAALAGWLSRLADAMYIPDERDGS